MSELPGAVQGNVGRAIAKGAAWSLIIRLVDRAVGVVSTIILARVLSPSDFGVYGLSMSVYALVELISAFGFASVLIQNRECTREHYDTAWTMNFVFSIVCLFLLYFGAPFAADFLREPRTEVALKFLGILFLVDAVKNVGIVNFQKHMEFNKEFKLRVIVKLCGFFVTVPLAIILRSYWAMLWGLLASSVMLVVLSYTMQAYRPKFGLSRWRELISFSSWLQVNNFLNYFNNNISNFLLSRISGASGVGSLTMAKESAEILREVAAPIHRAAFPGYALVNHDAGKLRDTFCDVMGALAVIGFGVAIGTFSVAHLMVPTLLGAKWIHIVPLVKYLSLAALMMLVIRSINDVLIAMGRVRWATTIIAIRVLLFIGFLLYFLPVYDLLGVPYASMITGAGVMVLSYLVLRFNIALGMRRFAGLFYKPLLAAVSMWIVVTLLFPLQWAGDNVISNIVQLLCAVSVGAVWYITFLVLLWLLQHRPEGPELHFLRLFYTRTGLLGFLIPRVETGA